MTEVIEKTKRPENSAFKQQRLTAWQPILTAGTVLPSFFIIGILFIPIGIFLLLLSDNVQEISIDYTECLIHPDQHIHNLSNLTHMVSREIGPESSSPNWNELEKEDLTGLKNVSGIKNKFKAGRPPAYSEDNDNGNGDDPLQRNVDINGDRINLSGKETKCSEVINQRNSKRTCTCAPLNFTIKKTFQGQVYIYYALTRFHQNHRRYVNSRDDAQLRGDMGSWKNPKKPSHDCRPYDQLKGKYIYPCGAIAHSMFSDEIKIYFRENIYPDDYEWKEVPLTNKGVAWESDVNHKFKHPSWWKDSLNDKNHPARTKFIQPLAWKKSIWDLENGIKNEDFVVWMRLAAYPNFRKLFRIVQHKNDPLFRRGLPNGTYKLEINYSYPVTTFAGTKSIVFSTTSLLGGKNPFLGIAYIVVGGICLSLGLVFLFIHINYASKVSAGSLSEQMSPKDSFTKEVDAKIHSHIHKSDSLTHSNNINPLNQSNTHSHPHAVTHAHKKGPKSKSGKSKDTERERSGSNPSLHLKDTHGHSKEHSKDNIHPKDQTHHNSGSKGDKEKENNRNSTPKERTHRNSNAKDKDHHKDKDKDHHK